MQTVPERRDGECQQRADMLAVLEGLIMFRLRPKVRVVT